MFEKRVNAVCDLLRLANNMEKTTYFYMTEDLENKDFSTEPTCPDIITQLITNFLTGTYLPNIECGTMSHYVMDFEIHFVVCHLPEHEGYCIIGPMRKKKPTNEEIEHYVKAHNLKDNYFYILKSYLESITNEYASSQPLLYICEHIYNTPLANYDESEIIYLNNIPEESISITPPIKPNMLYADEKYERERLLRTYIAQGKRREAGFLLETRDKIHYFRHSEGNCMLRLLSLNTICKLALADAKVTPSYIEKIYSTYIREIVTNLNSPLEERENYYSARMLDDYCKLARDFKTTETSIRVKKAKDYILLHYTERIKVEDIANYLEVTPNYLSSIFKKETETSLTSYINEVRVNSSLTLLANTNLPISEVAEQVGINDYNYFSRVFKKIVGISPTQYRKSIIKEA